jgi:hypothetical protein
VLAASEPDFQPRLGGTLPLTRRVECHTRQDISQQSRLALARLSAAATPIGSELVFAAHSPKARRMKNGRCRSRFYKSKCRRPRVSRWP